MSEVIKYEWRSGIDTVGIVLVKRDAGDFRAYIGVARDTSAEEDAAYIAAHGAKLTYREAFAFFPELKEAEYAGSQ